MTDAHFVFIVAFIGAIGHALYMHYCKREAPQHSRSVRWTACTLAIGVDLMFATAVTFIFLFLAR